MIASPVRGRKPEGDWRGTTNRKAAQGLSRLQKKKGRKEITNTDRLLEAGRVQPGVTRELILVKNLKKM